MKERAILVIARFDSLTGEPDLQDAADELRELAVSAGLSVGREFLVNAREPQASTLIGKGKLGEIRVAVLKERAQAVIFERELSPSQQRNLENQLGVKTLDRTQLILDIFAQRAKSGEGKLQVELAQLRYLLPRLSGKGNELSRLGGGVGTRGPGEQKLEVDRRRIRARVTRLERELEDLAARRSAMIDRKKEKSWPLVALAGYTNAGKSTLFNRLTGADVLIKDRLFSTLDTVTREFGFSGSGRGLLSDTVGFVRRLPHHLVESFKATLEEVRQADVLLHVLDASRPDRVQLAESVQDVLMGLGCDPEKILVVCNKVDRMTDEQRIALAHEPFFSKGIPVSAATGFGIGELLSKVSLSVREPQEERTFFIPREHYALMDVLYREARVDEREDRPAGVRVKVHISRRLGEWISKQLGEKR